MCCVSVLTPRPVSDGPSNLIGPFPWLENPSGLNEVWTSVDVGQIVQRKRHVLAVAAAIFFCSESFFPISKLTAASLFYNIFFPLSKLPLMTRINRRVVFAANVSLFYITRAVTTTTTTSTSAEKISSSIA